MVTAIKGNATSTFGGGLDLGSNNLITTGTCTATSFSGDGSALTGIASSPVLEYMVGVADGSTIVTSQDSYVMANVTAGQNIGTAYAVINGSSIAYTPPTGTKKVIYRFTFMNRWEGAHGICHIRFYIDGNEVTSARTGSSSQYVEDLVNFEWIINVGDGDNTANGKINTWTADKTLQLRAREYGGGNGVELHRTRYWDGADSPQLHKPTLTVIAVA